MTDRMSSADYRALTAGKPRHGSKRGSTGPTTGTCVVCGKPVRASDPAEFHTDHVRGVSWCRHLACRRSA